MVQLKHVPVLNILLGQVNEKISSHATKRLLCQFELF